MQNPELLGDLVIALLAAFVGGTLAHRLGQPVILGYLLAGMAIGPLLAPWLDLTFSQGLFLGALLSLSSTIVALKLLMDRGELGALHGRVALGILIAQDLAVVPMVVLLPALVGGGEGVVTELAGAA